MEKLLQEFENKEPEVVFEWQDSETSAKGWIVINSLRGGAAAGGTRMRIGVTKNEVLSLAKTMEVKFAVAGPNIGGGKSGMLDQSKLPKQSAAERRMPAAESRPVDAKKKRQARQASIIIEELERALGDLSTGGSRNRREDGEVLVDDASDISFYEETDMQ